MQTASLLSTDKPFKGPHTLSASTIFMQASGETCGTQAGGSPTGHTEGLPYYLLHQSSGTSASSGMTQQLAGLRHINTRKRATSFTAASPRQAPDYPIMTVSTNCNFIILFHKKMLPLCIVPPSCLPSVHSQGHSHVGVATFVPLLHTFHHLSSRCDAVSHV